MTWIVYTQANCAYCDQAKKALTDFGTGYGEKTLPEFKDELLSLYPDVKTVPQVFHRGKRIGGFEDLIQYLNTF